jgi:hypothetical protein
MDNRGAERDERIWRRFGSNHEKPCKRPECATCAMWECQMADECQWDFSLGRRRDPQGGHATSGGGVTPDQREVPVHCVAWEFENPKDATEAMDMIEALLPKEMLDRGFLSMAPEVASNADLLSALRTARDRLAMMLRPDDPRNDDAYCLVDDTIRRVEPGAARAVRGDVSERNFDERPYTPDEQRVADWLSVRCPNIGTGNDPIGFLLASFGLVLANREKEH